MRRRIVISLGILLALCLVGQAAALLALDQSISRLGGLTESHRIQAMRSSLNSSSVQVQRDLLAQLAGQEYDDERVRHTIWRFEDSLLQCQTCHHEPGVQSQLDAIQESIEGWLLDSEPVRTNAQRRPIGSQEQAILEQADAMVERTTALVDQAHRGLSARSSEVESIVHRAWVTLYATLAVALVFGGLVAFDLQRRLTKPVSQLLQMIGRSRHGSPPDGFSISGDEEFQQLGRAFEQAYRDLRNAQDGVLQAEKMAAIGRLAAGVAHEVTNPVASISSIVQMMRRRPEADRSDEQLDLLMEHVQRISNIVREFLVFSRVPRERERDRVAVDIAALLDQATDLLGLDRRSQGIQVVRDYGPGLEPVQGDAYRLVGVFTNLIINAYDAICDRGDGAGTLEISARDEGERLVIRFSDDGVGMSEETASNVFEPFFTTKEPGAGTGLGLWICYEAVREHGGRIRIESRPGDGTTVIIELPRDGGPPAD